MKRLLIYSFFLTLPVSAQNFSPSASGIGLQGTGSPEFITPDSSSALKNFTTPSSVFNIAPSTTAPNPFDQIPLPTTNGSEVLNQTNTAPTPIPQDTTLLFTPTADAIRQAQEAQGDTELNTPRNDTETAPGSIPGTPVTPIPNGSGTLQTNPTNVEP